MDIDTKCPHCTEENTYQVDLNTVLNTVVSPNYSAPVKFNSLEISLKPQPYFSVNKTNTINFEEQRILATINDESLADDVKSAKFNEHLQRLVSLNMDIMVDSTHSIKTPDNLIVADPTFIREFYQKADRKVVKEVRAWLEKAAAESAIKPVSVVCDDCKKAFDLSITFDYAHFFA
jgi:hypothetical protein